MLLALAVAIGVGALGAAPAVGDSIVHVNTTADETTAGDGACSLREAIVYADAANGADHDCGETPSGTTTIVLPTGDCVLSAGELKISGAVGPVVIDGAGTGSAGTMIDAAHKSRVLEVASGQTASLAGVTITGGLTSGGAAGIDGSLDGGAAAGGGGILNAGALTLEDVLVTDNATGAGGQADPFVNNEKAPGGIGGAGGDGAGIDNASGATLIISGSTISSNVSGAGGAGGPGAANTGPTGSPGGAEAPAGGAAASSMPGR